MIHLSEPNQTGSAPEDFSLKDDMQQFFLVVKVNYLFAFNVIKQNVYIDEHHKNQKIVEKGSNGAHRKICLLFASDDVC